MWNHDTWRSAIRSAPTRTCRRSLSTAVTVAFLPHDGNVTRTVCEPRRPLRGSSRQRDSMYAGRNRWRDTIVALAPRVAASQIRSEKRPAYACAGYDVSGPLAPRGARIYCSAGLATEPPRRACCERVTAPVAWLITVIPNAADPFPPTLATTFWSPSNSRAGSSPPYGKARWLSSTRSEEHT